MDLKGLKWAGNIYQMFEAMCLEVEEVMYEDTVKYVENQAQKVGASVKKFYSEVMQDLLPPSGVEPVKVAAGDLYLYPYVHTDINKKVNSVLDNLKEVDKKTAEDGVISDVNGEKKSSLSNHNDENHISQLSSRDLVQNKCSELYSVKSKNAGVHKRPIGIKRISQNRCPPKMTRPVTSLPRDSGSRLESDMKRSFPLDSDITNVTSSVRHDCTGTLDGNTPLPTAYDKMLTSRKDDSERVSPTSDKILSAQSGRKLEADSEQASLASDKGLSAESVRQKNDFSVCSSSCQGMYTESIGSSAKDVTFEEESVDEKVIAPDEGASTKGGSDFLLNSKVRSDTCHVESACKEDTISYEDNFDMELIDNEEVAEVGVESCEPVGKSTMDESCVLVDENKLQSVPLGPQKKKSYKKKIREALSSKLRPTKKQDQCITQREDFSGDNSEKRKIAGHHSLESEWELL